MASTDLNLLECGTLSKPGPIGRFVRLTFGILCLYYVHGLWTIRQDLFSQAQSIRPLIWNGIIPGLFLISYIVNIGFSRAWKKWPALVSIALLLIATLIGFMRSGQLESVILGRTIWTWEIYLFSHLGLSFLLASFLATPGCEMRSFHHFYSKLLGKPRRDHQCPLGPISMIDNWERLRATYK